MWTDFSIKSTAYPKPPAYGLDVKDTIFSSKNGTQCGRASHGSRDLLEAVISSRTARKWKCVFFPFTQHYISYIAHTFFKSHLHFLDLNLLSTLWMCENKTLIHDGCLAVCIGFVKNKKNTIYTSVHMMIDTWTNIYVTEWYFTVLLS